MKKIPIALLMALTLPVFLQAHALAQQTIVRVSFWIDPGDRAVFERDYDRAVPPVLEKHGYRASSVKPAVRIDNIFSRLYEIASPKQHANARHALLADSAWASVLTRLNRSYAGAEDTLRHRIGIYETPSGPGHTVPAGKGKGFWRVFDRSDGYPLGGTATIVDDEEGALWFCGAGGVARFDGQNWTHFDREDGLARDWVWGAARDRQGNLWFGSGDLMRDGTGVTRYRPKASPDSMWTVFDTEDGLVHNAVQTVAVDSLGYVWFGTPAGVSRYDPTRSGPAAWKTYTTENGLARNFTISITVDRSGCLWFTTGDHLGNGSGITRFDPAAEGADAWRTFTTKDGLADDATYYAAEDHDGNIWIATAFGISRYRPDAAGEEAWATYTMQDGLASNKHVGVLQDRSGIIWFGSESGLSRLDPFDNDGKGAWSKLTAKDGLAENIVWGLIEDREGQLWFGGSAGHVTRSSGASLATFGKADGLSDDRIRDLLEDQTGSVWIATPDGVCRYDGTTFTTFTPVDGLGAANVSTIYEDDRGAIWFGGPEGVVSRLDPSSNGGRGTWRCFTSEDGLVDGPLTDITGNAAGTLWFATGGVVLQGAGISRYDGEHFTTYTTADGLAHNGADEILLDDDNTLWAGTSRGLSRFQDGKWVTLRLQQIDSGFNLIIAMARASDGALWLTFWGDTRLVRFLPSPDLASMPHGTVVDLEASGAGSFTEFLGMDDAMTNIEWDDDGTLWIGTMGGGLGRFDERTVVALTRDDGLASNNARSVLLTRNGDVWSGSPNGGLTRFRPPPPLPPRVRIDAVVSDRRYEGISRHASSTDVGLVTIEYGAMSLKTRPGALVYRYRLTGWEEDWQTTYARRVEYQDLPAGHYAFEVEAVDRDLVYSDAPAVLDLTIHLPYQKYGLVSGLCIAVLLIGWQGARIVRANRLLRVANAEIAAQTERKSAFLASMAHELRTPMNAIKGFTNLVLRRAGDVLPDQQRQNLGKVDQASDHLLAMINDLLDLSKIEAGRMDVNVSTFDVRRTVLSACEVVGPLVQDGVELRHDIADDIGEAHTDQQRLSQMLINLLSNAVKFTERGSVAVEVSSLRAERLAQSANGEQLVISVSDTGRGIPEQDLPTLFDEYRQVDGQSESAVQRGTGLGLSITYRFAKLLGGTIDVQSEVGVGSTFTLTIPAIYRSGSQGEVDQL